MNDTPHVSVVIPVMNGEAHISDALESVLGQTFTSFEVIAVDDGSTDGTGDILLHYVCWDRRVVLMRQTNRGTAAARNVGLRVARGAVVAFLDADDIWLPEKLERQVAYLQQANCEACFTYAEVVDDALQVITPWNDLREKYGLAAVGPELLVERGNLIAGSASSVVARAKALREVGGFNERMAAAADLDLWYRLSLRSPIRAVPEVLVRIRRRSGQMQSDYGGVLVDRIQFLENVKRRGDERHAQVARRVERQLRIQLLRRSLRRGHLLEGGAQALLLLSRKRMRDLP